MKLSFNISLLSTVGASALLLSSCGSSGGFGGLYDPGYGPFDKEGNYLESQADKTAKQNRRPSVPGGSSVEEVKTVSSAPPTPVRRAETFSKPKPAPIVVKKPTYTKPATITKTTPKPVSRPTPKPKVVSRPKAKFAYHRVVKGDTLYSISKKHNTSVTKIQKANGIAGTIIKLGTTIKIPQ